ncbi:MAG: glycoside hydrolase TIM-barrel-like domain-containing protein, partial [Pseudomonadota bacterium]
WREGDALHADNPDGFAHHADVEAMKAQVEGGEGFDWYYASEWDRESRMRTPITDGAYDKPWVFRFKDLTGWWTNTHFDRRAGLELTNASAWQPKSKPVFLLEAGCTALRGGAVQPNVFPDAKSSENAKPKGSTGALSDAEQRAFLTAHHDYWSEAKAAMGADSPVDPDRIYAWAWDARPYPAFPLAAEVWGDGDNWHGGHWLNGRLGTAPLTETIHQLLTDFEVPDFGVGDIPHTMDGLVISSPQDARAVIDPLVSFYDVIVRDDSDGAHALSIEPTQASAIHSVPLGELAVTSDRPERAFIDAQRDEVPSSVLFNFRDPLYDYKRLAKTVRPSGSEGQFQTQLSAPGVTRNALAQQLAHAWGARALSRASSVEFDLPLKWIGIQAGDLITFEDTLNQHPWLVERLEISDRISIVARAYRPDSAYMIEDDVIYGLGSPQLAGDFGSIPEHVFLDAPANESLQDHECFMVAAIRPASRSTVVFASVDGEEHTLRSELLDDAVLGTLRTPLNVGAVSTWDWSSLLEIKTTAGEFSNLTDKAVLGGNNLAAIEKATGWEIISFANAEEVEPGVWLLRKLLRGLGGTEDLIAESAPSGARFVLLDSAVLPAGLRAEEVGREVSLRVGENGRPFTDRYFQTTLATPGTRARLPLRPAHLRAQRKNDN